jgi:hypothetical protein
LIDCWFFNAPGFVNYKKRCTRIAAASDKVYQLFAHGRWFPPGTPASSTTKTGRHDIAEISFYPSGAPVSSNSSYYYKEDKSVVIYLEHV